MTRRTAIVIVMLIALTACERNDEAPTPRRRTGNAATTRTATVQALPKNDVVAIAGGQVSHTDPYGNSDSAEVLPFKLDRYEVTVREFVRCIRAGACHVTDSLAAGDCNLLNPGRYDHPVNCMTRASAADYCAWTGQRLPTSAEWQLAAAGSEGRRYPWGDAGRPDIAPCVRGEHTCPRRRDSTGTPDGVMDLGGNVWEIGDAICAVPAPRRSMCARFTEVVHGGAWNTCNGVDAGCSKQLESVSVELASRVAPEAVGFRCAGSRASAM